MRFSKFTLFSLKLYYIINFFINLNKGTFINGLGLRNGHIFVESMRIVKHPYSYVTSNPKLFPSSQYDTRLYAVPKKKPSKRRTKIRRTAWMKRLPKNYRRPIMLDMWDVIKYTDGTYTKSRTIHQNWLNLPNTSLDGTHIFNMEILIGDSPDSAGLLLSSTLNSLHISKIFLLS